MSRKSTETVTVRTMYGTMEFESFAACEQFRKTIASWEGFTRSTAPQSGHEAVEYHLAYVAGGFPEVYAVIRHREMVGAIEAARIRTAEELKLQRAQAFAERVYQFQREELGYL